MSLDLHKDLKNRLEALLAERLTDIRVFRGTLVDYKSVVSLALIDKALPTTGKVHDDLQKYIGELPIILVFVYETLNRELEKGTYDSHGTETPLKKFPDYTDLDSLAARLVDDFVSLPWSYLVSFELPQRLGKSLRSISSVYLTPSLKIVVPDETYDSTYPLQLRESLSGILSGKPERGQWNKETAYVQVNVDGFVGKYFDTEPILGVIETLKSVIGLSLATRWMKIGKEHRVLPPLKGKLIVHRKIGETWQMWSTYELPASLSVAFDILDNDDWAGELKDDIAIKWLKERLQIISTAFENPHKAKHILSAAQWLFDGCTGANELLSFVQTTVAMEIMLGEDSKSDVIGISELLRNRCAYLIGKSHSQRGKILKEFNKIYDVRSKIVHRGKSRLTHEERALFQRLQWMCKRVISEELKLIVEDTNRPGA